MPWRLSTSFDFTVEVYLERQTSHMSTEALRDSIMLIQLVEGDMMNLLWILISLYKFHSALCSPPDLSKWPGTAFIRLREWASQDLVLAKGKPEYAI